MEATASSAAQKNWKNLSLVQANRTPPEARPARVHFTLEGSILVASFEVLAPKIFAKNPLPPGEFPYEYDVVEVFFAVNGSQDNYPYYEFEVSPYNQTFEVLVELRNGEKHFSYSMDYGISSSVAMTAQGWNAEMRIPLTNLPWTGKPSDIVGNAFTILGEGDDRAYWSLSLPPQAVANFHHPEFFKPLF